MSLSHFRLAANRNKSKNWSGRSSVSKRRTSGSRRRSRTWKRNSGPANGKRRRSPKGGERPIPHGLDGKPDRAFSAIGQRRRRVGGGSRRVGEHDRSSGSTATGSYPLPRASLPLHQVWQARERHRAGLGGGPVWGHGTPGGSGS